MRWLKMYDIFYVSRTQGDTQEWQSIKSRYPTAQRLVNINSFQEIKSRSLTKMFWVIWDDVRLEDSFDLFNYQLTKWDDMYIHVFKNGEHYDGVCLFSKKNIISQREFDNRFFVDKKEVDIVASYPISFKVYTPLTFEEYQQIEDEMFWIVWPEVSVIDPSVFNLYFSHHNSYDRRENHVFKNLCNDTESYLSGIILCSKHKSLSKREFDRKYLIDKKEHNIVASKYRYRQYTPVSYKEYLEICNKETSPLFWCVWPEIDIIDDCIFDFYFDPLDGKYDQDRTMNHTFMHRFNNVDIRINGLMLLSKHCIISRKEFNHRFLINKKEHDQVASEHRVYDVVFISYNEPNADDNYEKLLKHCPRAKRVHGVKGIHAAHFKAAEMCNTDMIWVVDGDAIIEDDFSFDLVMSSYDLDCVHVWKSRNPINNLEYGNGGIKLLPRQLTLKMDFNTPDMTTSISNKFKAMDMISNTNAFNTDEFSTWRSAFRECCKLASGVIDRQYQEETQLRLEAWCTIGSDKLYGKNSIQGALMGRAYGEANKNNANALCKINDFVWLQERYNEI